MRRVLMDATEVHVIAGLEQKSGLYIFSWLPIAGAWRHMTQTRLFSEHLIVLRIIQTMKVCSH